MKVTTRREASRAATIRVLGGLGLGFALAMVPAMLAFGDSVTLAGYSASVTSSALRYQLDSPGLLPFGDASTGNIVEVDTAFTRTSVSSGPVVDALGSPLYPGDAVANLGTAIGQFGGPPVPNDPVVADAKYPPSPPNHNQTESFSGLGVASRDFPIGAGNTESNAGPQGGSVTTSVSSLDLPSTRTSGALITVHSSDASNSVGLGEGSVSATATSMVTGIAIASVVDIASLDGSAGGRSDGTTGSPEASLRIGTVTVAGEPAYVDKDGIHLAGQPGQGAQGLATANAALQSLAASGISIHTIAPTQSVTGPAAAADSGALEVSMSGATPAAPGSPSLPFQVNLLLGNASIAVNASVAAPYASGPSTTPSNGPLPQAAPPLAASISGPGTETLSVSGPGGSAQAADNAGGDVLQNTGALLGLAPPVPLGLGIGLGLASLIAATGLLSYVRWQLIARRAR